MKKQCLVFGIHSYIDPLDKLKKTPKAADMIGRATSNMNEKTLKYFQASIEEFVFFPFFIYLYFVSFLEPMIAYRALYLS